MATKEVEIKVTSDTSQAEKDLGKLEKKTKEADKSTINLTSAFKTAGLAVAAVSGVVGGLVAAYRTQEQAEIKLEQTLKATGFAAGLSAKELKNLASGLQEVTTFGDEAILAAQSMLLTFKSIGEETFPRATEAVLDIAQAMGGDLQGASIQLGKALNDPIGGIASLTRVGVQFTNEQKEQIKSFVGTNDVASAQAVILGELESQFGGLARAAAGGTGAITQTKNLLGDIAESGGKILLPFVLKLNEALSTSAKFWNDVAGGIAASSDNTTEAAEDIEVLENKLLDLEAAYRTAEAGANVFIGNGLLGLKRGADAREEALRQWEETATKLTELRQNLADTEKRIEQEAYKGSEQARIEAQNNQLQETAEFNEALKLLREEFKIQEDEASLTEIEQLENKLNQEKFLEQQKQAESLKAEGKAQEALTKIRKTQQDLRLKNLKETSAAQLKLEQSTQDAKLDILANFGNLAATLGKKDNKIAFAIQKAAAIASAVVATQRAAALALPNLALASLIKIAGGLNVANIAAQTIKGFNRGGLVEGGIPNRDSVPAMLTPNEIVAPRKNFDEVIEGVARLRGFTRNDNRTTDSEPQRIEIGFSENAFEIIEGRLLERQSLGV